MVKIETYFLLPGQGILLTDSIIKEVSIEAMLVGMDLIKQEVTIQQRETNSIFSLEIGKEIEIPILPNTEGLLIFRGFQIEGRIIKSVFDIETESWRLISDFLE